MAWAHSGLKGLQETLGPAFEEAGLAPAPRTPGTVATFAGTVAGREVQVACSARAIHRYATSDISFRQFAGLHLQIQVETPLCTNLVSLQPMGVRLGGVDNVCVRAVILAAERYGNRKLAMRPVELPAGEHPVAARAADPSWAREILSPEVRRVLWDLLPAKNLGKMSPVGAWSFSFGPGAMTLGLTPEASTLSGPNLAHWLQTAVWLTQNAERFEPATLPDAAVPPPLPPPGAVRKQLLPKLLLGLGCLAMVPVFLLAFFGAGYLLVGERIVIGPILFALVLMPYSFYLLIRNFVRSAVWARQNAQRSHWSQRSARGAS